MQVTFLPMAIFPFALRALRIRRLFAARDKYWITDKMPKEQIKEICEMRIIKTFVKIGISMLIIYIILLTIILLSTKNQDLLVIREEPN